MFYRVFRLSFIKIGRRSHRPLNRIIACLLPSFFLCLVNTAYAGPYIGASLSNVNYDKPNTERAIIPADGNINGLEVTPDFQFTNEPIPELLFDLDDDLVGSNIKLGYDFFGWLGLEIRGGFGASDIDLDNYAQEFRTLQLEIDPVGDPGVFTTFAAATPLDEELNLEYYYGGYIRLGGGSQTEILRVSPYLLYGYSRAHFTATNETGTAQGRLGDSSYGGGVNIRLSPDDRLYFNIEYIDLFSQRGTNVMSWSSGIEYRL